MTDTTEDKDKDKDKHARANADAWLESIKEMLDAIGDGPEAEQEGKTEELRQSVLSVEVRSGWMEPGAFLRGSHVGQPHAEEYSILLTTGGPALRIFGQLNVYCEPISAELQVQDWFVPWTRHPAPEATLLKFAAYFWYGE